MKICTKCKKKKDRGQFFKSCLTIDGLQSWCKECMKEDGTKHNRKRFTGCPPEEYNRLLEEQNNICAICEGVNKDGKQLFVDHNHRTGKIRGVLCRKCNMGLGYFNDNKELLIKAVKYLSSRDKI